jgi:hypothetical protein
VSGGRAEQAPRRDDDGLADLRRLKKSVDAHARQVESLKTDLKRLRAAYRQHAAYTEKLEGFLPRQMADRARLNERLERIAASGRPIVVGPWTGEVGYEVLYWEPFVRWFVQHYEVDRSRLQVISRGGPVSWYGDLASRYADALSFFSPDEFRDFAATRAWLKQDEVTALDGEILRRVRSAHGRVRASLLHPSLMFRALKGYWGGRIPLKDVFGSTVHRRLAPPALLPGLPPRYMAVRFYFRSSFPDTPENRALASRTLAALTAAGDVVVLNPGFRVDDHHDYAVDRGGRIHTIDHLLTPERNLEVQTAAIAGADAFVGSYGGFSYLAPLLGVKSVAFYSAHTFKTLHLELAERVFERVGGSSLTVLNTADMDLVAGAVSAVAGGT